VDVAELHAALVDNQRTWVQTRAEVRRTPYGFIVRDLDHPLVYDANLSWVDRAPSGGADEILGDLDEAFRGTGIDHRRVFFADAEDAYVHQDAFVAAGFQAQADLVMAKVGLPSCIVNPDVQVREIGLDAPEKDFRLVQAALFAEAEHTDKGFPQVYDVGRVRGEAIGERAFVGYLEGEPAATYTLWPRGRFAEITTLGTLPSFRMRGVGRTLVHHGCTTAAVARCEYVLLTADLFDTPQQMYKTLGFEAVGELRGFLRKPE
jgi:ribosomal protein S18 acetylase RimI-like enzyme